MHTMCVKPTKPLLKDFKDVLIDCGHRSVVKMPITMQDVSINDQIQKYTLISFVFGPTGEGTSA